MQLLSKGGRVFKQCRKTGGGVHVRGTAWKWCKFKHSVATPRQEWCGVTALVPMRACHPRALLRTGWWAWLQKPGLKCLTFLVMGTAGPIVQSSDPIAQVYRANRGGTTTSGWSVASVYWLCTFTRTIDNQRIAWPLLLSNQSQVVVTSWNCQGDNWTSCVIMTFPFDLWWENQRPFKDGLYLMLAGVAVKRLDWIRKKEKKRKRYWLCND